MKRWMSAAVAVCVAVGCSSALVETTPEASPDSFAGAWRSVTPTMEFIRLSVVSKSSEQGALGARLTLSGLYWEGSGRVVGDSLVMDMAAAGAATPTAVLVAHVREGQTLRMQLRQLALTSSLSALDVTFVRED